MIPKEINIICIGERYRFAGETIQSWDFDYSDTILRIDFKDGSFIEFYKQNIICVEFNKDEEQEDNHCRNTMEKEIHKLFKNTMNGTAGEFVQGWNMALKKVLEVMESEG